MTIKGPDYSVRFFWGTVINVILVLVEIYFGIISNSVTLISDALHNASDSVGLLIAWGGYLMSRLKPSKRFTFGFKNTTIMAAFLNAMLIFVAVGGICWEAIQRFGNTQTINSPVVLKVAFIAMLFNLVVALMFLSDKKDVNVRGAFLHMAADALVSLGVIISTLCIMWTGWYWIDPLVSILISLLIVISSWSLFKESTNLMLHAVPSHIDLDKVQSMLLDQPHVIAIHDLHIWALSSSETAISLHLLVEQNSDQSDLLKRMTQKLELDFGIAHSTIQMEVERTPNCSTLCDPTAGTSN